MLREAGKVLLLCVLASSPSLLAEDAPSRSDSEALPTEPAWDQSTNNPLSSGSSATDSTEALPADAAELAPRDAGELRRVDTGEMPVSGSDELDSSLTAPSDATAESETTEEAAPDEPAEPTVPAGTGYFSFYDFGSLPSYVGSDMLALPLAWASNVPGSTALKTFGAFRWGVSASTGVAYTSNADGSTNDPESDLVYSLTPTIFIETGNIGTYRLLYSPSLQVYSENPSQNGVDQTLLASFDYPFSKLAIGGNIAYTTRSGVFASNSSQGFSELNSYAGQLYATYPLTSRIFTRATYSASLQESDDNSQFTNVLNLSANYAFTKRLSLGVYVAPGVESSENDTQRYVSAGLQAYYQATTRIQTFGSIGYQIRDLSDSSALSNGLTTPIFNLGAAWTPFPVLSIQATAHRIVSNNVFDSSQATINTGGALQATLTMWQRLVWNASGGLDYVEQDSNSGEFDQEYTQARLALSVSCPVTRNTSINLYTNYFARSPISGSTELTRFVGGIILTWSF